MEITRATKEISRIRYAHYHQFEGENGNELISLKDGRYALDTAKKLQKTTVCSNDLPLPPPPPPPP
jgi:hypothetical protein